MSNVALIPEVCCSNISKSLKFYTEILGFSIRYQRPEERFAYLEREGAEIMIEQAMDPKRTFVVGELLYPYGRGMNLQIRVSDVDSLYSTAQANNCSIFLPLEEKWYRANELDRGNRQFVIMDPDGYLLRFAQDLGTRPLKLM